MDKRDPAMDASTRFGVDQLNPVVSEPVKRCFDVVHGNRDMMKRFAVPLQKSAYPTLGIHGTDQLKVRVTKSKESDLNPLIRYCRA